MTADLRARIEDLREQVQIGSGEDDLAAALHAVLDLCEEREADGARSLTTRMVREAVRHGLG